MASGHQAGKALEAAVVSALYILGKAAGGKLSHTQVTLQALAADAMFLAARVSAVTEPCVARLRIWTWRRIH